MLEVFEGLMDTDEVELPEGHTIDTYRRENRRLKELLQQGDALAQKPFILNQWLELMEQILPYKVHFSRKQTEPVDTAMFLETYREMAVDLRDLMEKEEMILYSTSLKLISADKMEQLKSGDREIGFFGLEQTSYGDAGKKHSKQPIAGQYSSGYQRPEKATGQPAEQGDFMQDLAALLAKYGHETGSGKQEPRSAPTRG